MAIYGREGCGNNDVFNDLISRIFFIFCKNFAETGCDHYSKVIKGRLIS